VTWLLAGGRSRLALLLPSGRSTATLCQTPTSDSARARLPSDLPSEYKGEYLARYVSELSEYKRM